MCASIPSVRPLLVFSVGAPCAADGVVRLRWPTGAGTGKSFVLREVIKALTADASVGPARLFITASTGTPAALRLCRIDVCGLGGAATPLQ